MVVTLMTLLMAASRIGPVGQTVQDSQVTITIAIAGAERGGFVPRLEPYTQGGPSVSFPVPEGESKTKDGLPIRGFQFIGWKEADGVRVFAFVVVPPAPGSPDGADRRLDFGSVHIRSGEKLAFDKMKDVGIAPWTITAKPRGEPRGK